jgi:hypothetical protein
MPVTGRVAWRLGEDNPLRQVHLMGGAEGGFRLDVHVHGGRGRSEAPKLVNSAGDRREGCDQRWWERTCACTCVRWHLLRHCGRRTMIVSSGSGNKQPTARARPLALRLVGM